jgi:hypothetical protein
VNLDQTQKYGLAISLQFTIQDLQLVAMYNKKESDVYVRAERWCIVEVVVIYDYDARDEDELTLRVNDIIKDVSVQDGGWWTGVLHGRRGFFPDNFVKVMLAKCLVVSFMYI